MISIFITIKIPSLILIKIQSLSRYLPSLFPTKLYVSQWWRLKSLSSRLWCCRIPTFERIMLSEAGGCMVLQNVILLHQKTMTWIHHSLTITIFISIFVFHDERCQNSIPLHSARKKPCIYVLQRRNVTVCRLFLMYVELGAKPMMMLAVYTK